MRGRWGIRASTFDGKIIWSGELVGPVALLAFWRLLARPDVQTCELVDCKGDALAIADRARTMSLDEQVAELRALLDRRQRFIQLTHEGRYELQKRIDHQRETIEQQHTQIVELQTKLAGVTA